MKRQWVRAPDPPTRLFAVINLLFSLANSAIIISDLESPGLPAATVTTVPCYIVKPCQAELHETCMLTPIGNSDTTVLGSPTKECFSLGNAQGMEVRTAAL
ncbi:hypothetical protein B0H15DRAFT_50882 [Mycena belliarum]|uniref:Uncharacterized protein n=1 Tax=Mycena belliarum TaxID=1033014 RepID=A0AAD6UGX6_9AGAR|nr:hypothetical protein B0H15DRAFT_50882 [Mycena belliae]